MATKFNAYTALENPRYQLARFRPELSSARLIVFENANHENVGLLPPAARELYTAAALYAQLAEPSEAGPIPYKQIAALLKGGLDYHATHLAPPASTPSPSQAMCLAAVPEAERRAATEVMGLCLIAATAKAGRALYFEPKDHTTLVGSITYRPTPP